MNYKWFGKQDRAFLENTCGDYTDDVIELVRDYIFIDRYNPFDIPIDDDIK